jgi:hypothetical protein
MYREKSHFHFGGRQGWSEWQKWRGWRESIPILAVLLLGLAIRLYAIWDYKLGLTLHSDDAGYVQSAKWLIENGTYSYYVPGVPTLHMMPGITYFLAFFFVLFGQGTIGMFAAKIGMTLVGMCGIYGVYLLGKRLWHPYVGLAGALLAAIYLPGIETDTLYLTETPFMTASVFLLCFSVRLARTRSIRDLLLVALFYVISVYFRPTVLLYPVLLLIYLLCKRYPWQLLLRHVLVACVAIVFLMSPWWIRNATTFHRFVPLTDGTGNPLLLGTYQGHDYPNERTVDQELAQILQEHPELRPQYMHEQAWMNAQKELAITRMKTWYHDNPSAFINSYAVVKPGLLWGDPFYWLTIFKVQDYTLKAVQAYLVWAGMIGYLIAMLLGRRSKRESFFILLMFLYYTVLYSIYFVFGRYSEPMMPIVMMGIGAGIYAILSRLFGANTRDDW